MSHANSTGIEFRKRLLRPSVLGVLLVMATANFMLARMSRAMGDALETSEAKLELAASASERRAIRPRIAEGNLSKTGERQWAEQIALLNKDWSGLLNALVPLDKKTRLLDIDVNPATGVVRISGVTDSADRANGYAQALEAKTGSVSEVRVLSLKRNGNEHIFEVSALWRE